MQAGGQGWSVPAGRRDGTVSSATEATSNLPASTMMVPDLLPIFNGKGLTAAQMVTLSGISSSNHGFYNTIMDEK